MKRIILAILLLWAVTSEAQVSRTRVSVLRYENMAGRTLPTPIDGSIWRIGDTMFTYYGGLTIKELISAPLDGQIKIYDSVLQMWKWGNSGVGSAPRWNELTNPNGLINLSLGTYPFLTSSGTTTAGVPAVWFRGDDNLGTGYVHLVSTSQAFAMNRVWGAFARGTTHGVYVDSVGNFRYAGSATVDANRWKGSATFDKASQHAQTAYKDVFNSFLANQMITYSGASVSLTVLNTGNTASSIAIHGVGQTAPGVKGTSSSSYGVFGESNSGQGGTFGSLNGSMMSLFYGPTKATRLTFNTDAIVPETGVDLGTQAKPFENLYVNNFVDLGVHAAKDVFVGDTIYVYGLTGVDSSWVGFANVIGAPQGLFDLGVQTFNDGHIEITSSSEDMAGTRVQWMVRRATQ